MVHNGIEYGDMQLIAEAYNIMKDVMDLSHREMADIFADWNATELDSFLIEITSNILRFEASHLFTFLYFPLSAKSYCLTSS